MINNLLELSQKHFPNLRIKYKDQSSFMKLLGNVLFFNKEFMTNYTTTIGSTIYFPNEKYLNIRPISSVIVLLHELVHLYDSKRLTSPLFSFLYLSPQILALLFFPLLLVSWKLALPFLLFALPIPSFFRMYFEKRAYLSSLYVTYQLSKKKGFNSSLESHKNFFIKQFKGGYYYFMWTFSLTKEFDQALVKINNNERPFEDPVFDILDDLISQL